MGERAHRSPEHPEGTRTKSLWILPTFGVTFALFFLGFVWSSLHYPYYHLWDGDAVACIDTLLMVSGLLPTHVHHTAFGVYLLLVPFARVGHMLGWISLGGLPDLETALSPYASAAEFMTDLKLAYPLIIVVLWLALWSSLSLAFRPRPWTAFALMLFLGMQEVLFWGASIIRSETASLTYWAVAVVFLVLAVQSTRFARKMGWIFCAGLFLGLSFLTKLQAAPQVVVAGLLYLWMESMENREQLPVSMTPSVGQGKLLASLGVLAFVAFSLVGWAAWRFPLECSGALTGEQSYFWAGYDGASFSLFRGAGFPVWMTLAFLALSPLIWVRWPDAPFSVRMSFHAATVGAVGFCAVFLLHFLFFQDLSEGWRYLLVDFKVAFFRGREQFMETSLNENRIDLVRMALHFKWTLLLHVGLCAAMLAGCWRGILDIPRKTALFAVAGTGMLLLVSVFFVRFRENDMLWIQIPFNLISLFYAGVLIRRARCFERVIAGAVLVAFGALFVVNAADASTLHRRIDANYGIFGWKDFWVMQGIFGGHRPYDQCLKTFYTTPAMSNAGFRQAAQRQDNRRLANFIFQNQRIPQMNIGIVAEGFPVWRDARQYRIQSFSPRLDEAIVVDSASLPRLDFAFYDKERMRKHNSVPEKFEQRGGQDLVAVSARADAEILLFVRGDDQEPVLKAINDFRRPVAEAAPFQITLSDGASSQVYSSIRVLNYAELPVDLVGENYFFALIKRHSREH